MKRSFLKDLGLNEEQIDSILNEAGKDLESTKSTLNDEIARLKGDISTRDGQLEELKKSAKSNESLESEINKLQEKNKADAEAYEKQIRDIHINNAVKDALTDAKAKNQDVIKPLLAEFLSNAEVTEGVVKGLDDEIKKLVEGDTTSFLFETKSAEPAAPELSGITPAEGKDIDGGTFDMKTATYEQLVKYQEEHPEVNIFEN